MRMQFLSKSKTKLLFILALAALLRLWGLGGKQLWMDELLQLLHSRPNTLRGILRASRRIGGSAA